MDIENLNVDELEGLSDEQRKQVAEYCSMYHSVEARYRKRFRLKVELFIEQNGACCICERAMRLVYNGSTGNCATFEHVKVRSQGGTFKKDNVPLSCGTCNMARKTRNFDKFKQHVRETGKYPKGPSYPPNKRTILRHQASCGDPDALEHFIAKKLESELYVMSVEGGWREHPGEKIVETIKKNIAQPITLAPKKNSKSFHFPVDTHKNLF